jgi:hypothetical protein
MAKFRFEDLEIWKEAIVLAMIFFDIADELEQKKLWRFADQCRGVGMGMPNKSNYALLDLRQAPFFLQGNKLPCNKIGRAYGTFVYHK